MSLLEWTENNFMKKFGKSESEQKEMYKQAVRMMNSSLNVSFNLDHEPRAIREA
jgi:hypothetical protein